MSALGVVEREQEEEARKRDPQAWMPHALSTSDEIVRETMRQRRLISLRIAAAKLGLTPPQKND